MTWDFSRREKSSLCKNYVSAMIGFRQGGELPVPKGTLRLQLSFHHLLCRKEEKDCVAEMRSFSWLRRDCTGQEYVEAKSRTTPFCNCVCVSCIRETTTTARHGHRPPRCLGIGYQRPTVWKPLLRVVEQCLLLWLQAKICCFYV